MQEFLVSEQGNCKNFKGKIASNTLRHTRQVAEQYRGECILHIKCIIMDFTSIVGNISSKVAMSAQLGPGEQCVLMESCVCQ